MVHHYNLFLLIHIGTLIDGASKFCGIIANGGGTCQGIGANAKAICQLCLACQGGSENTLCRFGENTLEFLVVIVVDYLKGVALYTNVIYISVKIGLQNNRIKRSGAGNLLTRKLLHAIY